jgi:hypothetical protein
MDPPYIFPTTKLPDPDTVMSVKLLAAVVLGAGDFELNKLASIQTMPRVVTTI